MGDDGVPRATVFAEMSALAARTGAVNLGQGFPDVDGPASVARAAADAIAAGANQYPPGPGHPRAAAGGRRAPGVAATGCDWDPDREVLVTAGATEALAATVLALAGPGDEVLTLEPFYDSYAAVDRARGRHAHDRAAASRPPDGFRLDLDALAAAFTAADPAGPGEHPAQPDRHRADPRRARGDRPARRRARRAGASPTRCTSTCVLDGSGAPARADRDPARHGRADADHLVGGQDVLVHRLEDRLGHRPGARWSPRSGPSSSSSPTSTAHRSSRRSRSRCGDPDVAAWVVELAALAVPSPGPAVRRARRTRGSPSSGRRARTSCSPTPRPSGTPTAPPCAGTCRGSPAWSACPSRAFTHAGSDVDRALRSWVRFTFVKRDEVLTQAVAGLHRLHRG